jgi:flagellar hook-length control protein FliK
MVDVAALSHLPTEAASRRRNVSAPDDASQFSYALAAVSLEKRASQSLKTHGATPSGEIGASSKSSDAHSAATGADQSAQSPERPGSTPAVDEGATPTPVPMIDQRAVARSGAAATPATNSPILVAPGNTTTTAQIRAAEPLSGRDASGVRNRAAPEKAPRALPEAAILKTAFAEILARRLEKTSVFDLRLDPPEMGRVEGRLAIDDKGKGVLSLTFDNQNAFDLYSRDEQALRQALHHAGLDFAAGDFVFSFKEQPSATITAPDTFVLNSEVSAPYEPLFDASWTAGAVDIRV